MIDYRKIWDSINTESRDKHPASLIARRIPSEGVFPVFLATDFGRGMRLLFIKLHSGQDIATGNLPRFRGLEINIIHTSLGDFQGERFLRFTQSMPHTDNIFELVISDICESVTKIRDRDKLDATLTRVLHEWKLFFEKDEDQILSVERQKGLLGELYFLRFCLFSKYSFSESISYWTGPDRTNHDFQLLNKAVEIKTTSSQQHRKFVISSEKQLDSTGLEALYLAVFYLNLHGNMPDHTLPVFIREIYGHIEEDPVAGFQLQVKLTKYGYKELLADQYTVGFSIQEVKYFQVTDGFPRLVQQNLPNGVGDLQYSVVVAACNSFEIRDSIINYI
jgi:hypothetical protein